MINREQDKHMLQVFHGSITNHEKNFLIDNIAIIVDFDLGVILKYGDIDTSDIKHSYEERYAKLNESGFDIKFITFDRYDGALSIDEICTFVNYGRNAHEKAFLELFEMEEESLKARLKQLNECGY